MGRIGVVLHKAFMQPLPVHARRQQAQLQRYGQHDALAKSTIGRDKHRPLQQAALLLDLRNMFVRQAQTINLKCRHLRRALPFKFLHPDPPFAGIARHGINGHRVVRGQ